MGYTTYRLTPHKIIAFSKCAPLQFIPFLTADIELQHSASCTRRKTPVATEPLARAVGLRGRPRRVASYTEQARVNVTRALRAAMGKITPYHRALGQHLAATVSTGFFCAYTPDPRLPVCWQP